MDNDKTKDNTPFDNLNDGGVSSAGNNLDDTSDDVKANSDKDAGDQGHKSRDDKDSNDQLKKLQERIDELENNWKRALADYRNLERRTAEEKLEFAEFANMVLIQRLLPILDNLELLEKHVNDTGLKMIVKEFRQVLSDNGVEPIDSDGKAFDSQTMDCVETAECGEESHDKVVETLTRGYKFKTKILRPARVRVGKAKS